MNSTCIKPEPLYVGKAWNETDRTSDIVTPFLQTGQCYIHGNHMAAYFKHMQWPLINWQLINLITCRQRLLFSTEAAAHLSIRMLDPHVIYVRILVITHDEICGMGFIYNIHGILVSSDT